MEADYIWVRMVIACAGMAIVMYLMALWIAQSPKNDGYPFSLGKGESAVLKGTYWPDWTEYGGGGDFIKTRIYSEFRCQYPWAEPKVYAIVGKDDKVTETIVFSGRVGIAWKEFTGVEYAR